ncbi:hypothetical protein BJX61DRAFT_537612 [Aspergillus egyptiacus]|nr:hypothetical protein BJX61DRAFT_537612 [Aspergillus egyptiacus]
MFVALSRIHYYEYGPAWEKVRAMHDWIGPKHVKNSQESQESQEVDEESIILRTVEPLLLVTLVRCPESPVRKFPRSNFPRSDPSKKLEELEEETLSWDLPQHASLKVFERDAAKGKRETKAYDHLESLSVDHARAYPHQLSTLDRFQIASVEETFGCLVHLPMGISLFKFRHYFSAKVLPENITKLAQINAYSSCSAIRPITGKKKKKRIVLAIEDSSIVMDFKEAVKSDQSPQKLVEGRAIYASRKPTKIKQHGRPTLYGFGQTRFGSRTYSDMIAVIRLPAKEMAQQSAYASNFFDSEGSWDSTIKIPAFSLEKPEGK